MVKAIHTSVLLDVLLNDARHVSASMAALHLAAAQGPLIISEVALAEVVPVLPRGEASKARFLPVTVPNDDCAWKDT